MLAGDIKNIQEMLREMELFLQPINGMAGYPEIATLDDKGDIISLQAIDTDFVRHISLCLDIDCNIPEFR
jgi:hypothetical protein